MSHVTQTPLLRSKFQRSRSPGRFGWLFKSLHNLYGWHHILRHRPERAAACRPWGGGTVWRPPPTASLFL